MTLSYPLEITNSFLLTLFKLENVMLSIQDMTTLNPSVFKIVRFNEGGYAILFNDSIVEYDLSKILLFDKQDTLFYDGPLHLFILKNNEKIPVPVVENLNQKEPDLNWIGILSERFYPYRKWVNKDGTCGMYAAAILLSYYQDYIDERILPHSLRKPHSEDGERIIMAMKVYIHSLSFRGTIAFDVSNGINRFLRDYKITDKVNYKIKASGSILPTYGIVSTRLSSEVPKPVIVGLFFWLGSPKNYLNHWVVAYSYTEENGERYYRVHDNHGRYKAVINVKWTVSSIRLLRTLD